MIVKIDNTDEIKPLFREYLNHMTQFFKIKNHDSWCKSAVKNLNQYSIEDDRHIYALKEAEPLIGFALVNKHLRFNGDGFAVAEFYIQKTHERKKYGTTLARYVFEQFPGHWEVAVSLKNHSAITFWEQVVSSYTAGKYTKKRSPSFSGYGFVFNTAA